jgi:hypothetical protein
MGLLDSLFGDQRMSDPVRGSAQVVSCSANRGRGVHQNCPFPAAAATARDRQLRRAHEPPRAPGQAAPTAR